MTRHRRRYVSRMNPRDNTRHTILSTTSIRPLDFAAQLNVSLANGWGIVRTVVDLALKAPEGKYVLLKDPNKVRRPLLPFISECESQKGVCAARHPVLPRPGQHIRRCRRRGRGGRGGGVRGRARPGHLMAVFV